MNKKIAFVAVIVLVLVALAVGYRMLAPESAEPTDGETAPKVEKPRAKSVSRSAVKPSAKQSKVAVKTGSSATPTAVKSVRRVAIDETQLSPVERQQVETIQKALDTENLDEVLKAADAARDNPSAAVRHKAVEALQWFGKKALPELTPYLADCDPEVKSEAEDAVEQALTEMDDDQAKIKYIEGVISLKGAVGEDTLTMLSGQLNAIEDETLVVEMATRVIETGKNPAAAEAMKETYEFATGETYTDAQTSDTWVKNHRAEAAAEQL